VQPLAACLVHGGAAARGAWAAGSWTVSCSGACLRGAYGAAWPTV
jgi:hypothetical protein